MRRMHIVLCGIAIALGIAMLPSPAAATWRPPTVTGAGRTFITDEYGRAMNLRGFNIGDKPEELWNRISKADFDRIAANGFDYVRLVVRWTSIEPVQGQYDRAYLKKIRTVMDWAHANGIKVMLDMHQDVYGPAYGGTQGIPKFYTRDDGLPFWETPGDWFAGYFTPAVGRAFTHLYNDADLRQAQINAWMQFVNYLSDHPALLGYDLLNEPMGELTEEEFQALAEHGVVSPEGAAALIQAATRIETTQITPMYQRLTDAIRKKDRKSWIFVEPTPLVGQGVPTALGAINDPAKRIGYVPHYYNVTTEDQKEWPGNDGFIENYEAAIRAYPESNGYPTLVGEWGMGTGFPNNRNLVGLQLQSMDKFASGWAWWFWCQGGEGSYCAESSAGALNPGVAQLRQTYAQAIAGTPQATSYNPATGEYQVTFKNMWGIPTRLYLDPTHYPKGVDIKVSGGASLSRYNSSKRLLDVTSYARPGSTVTITVKPGTRFPR